VDLRYGGSVTVEIGWCTGLGFWKGPEKVTTNMAPQSQDIRVRLAFAEESCATLADCLNRLEKIGQNQPADDPLNIKVKKLSDSIRAGWLAHRAFLYFMQAVDFLWKSRTASPWPALKKRLEERTLECLKNAQEVQEALASFETNDREREGLLFMGQRNMLEPVKKWRNLVEGQISRSLPPKGDA
jgi:hypothetical protein